MFGSVLSGGMDILRLTINTFCPKVHISTLYMYAIYSIISVYLLLINQREEIKRNGWAFAEFSVFKRKRKAQSVQPLGRTTGFKYSEVCEQKSKIYYDR